MTDWFKKIQHLNPEGYIDSRVKYTFEAEQCKHIFTAVYKMYNKYYIELCPSCLNLPKWYDLSLNKVEDYIGYNGKYNFVSECGHIVTEKEKVFTNTYKNKCKDCQLLEKQEKINAKKAEVSQVIPPWYEPLINEKYITYEDTYNFTADCGHVFTGTNYQFNYNNKRLCNKCKNELLEPDWFKLIKHLNPQGFTNSHNKYNFISDCGHKISCTIYHYNQLYKKQCLVCKTAPWFEWDINPQGYTDNKAQYNVRLDCGHIHTMTVSAYLAEAKTQCPICGTDWFDIELNPDGYKGSMEKYYFRSDCGHVLKYKVLYGTFIGCFKEACPDCKEYKSSFNSNEEQEVADYVQSLYNGEIKRSVRHIVGSKKQIDILLLDKNIAIEYNGIKWHSEHESGKDELYHISKTNMCESQNIQLLHINSDEWKDKNKQEIWKSIISSKLCKTNKIYARKCTIKEVGTHEAQNFINDNHLQGYAGAKYKLGLYYHNELVLVMTFSKARYSNMDMWELIRLASLKYTTVVGGMSKLLNYFNKIYNKENLSILSYADRRYSIGKSYKSVGFIQTGVTPPGYSYFYKTSYHIMFSREKFMKHKLKHILPLFDDSLTEWENMKNNGYDRIWNCGNLTFIKDFNEQHSN